MPNPRFKIVSKETPIKLKVTCSCGMIHYISEDEEDIDAKTGALKLTMISTPPEDVAQPAKGEPDVTTKTEPVEPVTPPKRKSLFHGKFS